MDLKQAEKQKIDYICNYFKSNIFFISLKKTDLKKVQKDIRDFYTDINFYRRFSNKIIKNEKILYKEKKDFIENILIKICAKWEKLVDEILIYEFSRDTSDFCKKAGVKIKKTISLDYSQAIIFRTGFFDFKNIDNLANNAGKFVTIPKNVFKKISKPDKTKLDEVYIIRNYLSHYSKSSKRTLFKMYKSPYKIKYFTEPGHFLLKESSSNIEGRSVKIRRIDIYINSFGSAVKSIEEEL